MCEPIVKKHYDAVAKALDWLAEYAPPRMTGTGACIFAPFDSQQQAQQVLTALPSDWQGFVAKGCNQSPLAQFLSTLEVEVTARC